MLFHERVASILEGSSVRLGYAGFGFAKVYESEIGGASEVKYTLLDHLPFSHYG